jgi:hypothetical protein
MDIDAMLDHMSGCRVRMAALEAEPRWAASSPTRKIAAIRERF